VPAWTAGVLTLSAQPAQPRLPHTHQIHGHELSIDCTASGDGVIDPRDILARYHSIPRFGNDPITMQVSNTGSIRSTSWAPATGNSPRPPQATRSTRAYDPRFPPEPLLRSASTTTLRGPLLPCPPFTTTRTHLHTVGDRFDSAAETGERAAPQR